MPDNFDFKKFILVTDFDNSGEDVLIHCYNLTPKQCESLLKAKNKSFGECYEVPEKDIQYYIYDPLHLSLKEEANIIAHAQKIAA